MQHCAHRPQAGSALTQLNATAVRDGDDLILNGTKSFLTGSNVNDLNATFVRFDDVPGAKGIGAIVVEASMPGVEVQRGPVYIGVAESITATRCCATFGWPPKTSSSARASSPG